MTELTVSQLMDELKAFVSEDPRTREEMTAHLTTFTGDVGIASAVICKAAKDGIIVIMPHTNASKWTSKEMACAAETSEVME